jgi:hypothetical protein
MGDNGFSTWFRDFAKETIFEVWGNPNASAPKEADTQAQRATESAESGASELVGLCQYITCMHRPGEAGCASPSAAPPCRHQWLRPDNGTIECAACGATRWHYGD